MSKVGGLEWFGEGVAPPPDKRRRVRSTKPLYLFVGTHLNQGITKQSHEVAKKHAKIARKEKRLREVYRNIKNNVLRQVFLVESEASEDLEFHVQITENNRTSYGEMVVHQDLETQSLINDYGYDTAIEVIAKLIIDKANELQPKSSNH